MMKRFLLTAPSFTGAAILVYNEEGVLVALDLRQTNLTGKWAVWFYRNIPVYFDGNNETGEIGLEAFLNGRKGAKAVQEDVEITFEMFWEKYGKKINKKRCLPLWNKLTKAKQVAAYYGIWPYDRYLAGAGGWGRTKLDPENYLRNESWDNEWK